MSSYIMLFLSAILLAVDFLIAKLYQKEEGNSPEKVLRFNFFIGLFSAVIFFFINGCKFEFTWFSAVLAVVMTSLAILYTLVGFQILAGGGATYYSFFLMTGGMTVPYVWGLLFLKEPFSWLRMVGLAVIFGAAFVIYAGKQKISGKIFAMCGIIFLLNGFVSVISKQHQISTLAVSSAAYVILTALVKVFLCGGILAGLHLKKAQPSGRRKISPKALLLLAASALVSGVSYLLQLNGAAKLPATVLYPIITGGSILFTVIAGWLVLKEKPSKQLVLGVLLCLAGTCLFL